MEAVTFLAASGNDSHKWFSVNDGSHEKDFSVIVTSSEAKDFVNRLRAGETIYLPGFYDLDQIMHKFGGRSND